MITRRAFFKTAGLAAASLAALPVATQLPLDMGLSNPEHDALLSSLDIRNAVRLLRANNIYTFKDGYYHAYIHPDVEYDLASDPAVINIFQYAVPRDTNPLSAVPAIYGVKFIRQVMPEYVRHRDAIGKYPRIDGVYQTHVQIWSSSSVALHPETDRYATHISGLIENPFSE